MYVANEQNDQALAQLFDVLSLAGRPWTNKMTGCLQYSSPAVVTFPISIGMIPDTNSAGLDQSITYIRYSYNAKLANIVLKARGSQIQVSIVKK